MNLENILSGVIEFLPIGIRDILNEKYHGVHSYSGSRRIISGPKLKIETIKLENHQIVRKIEIESPVEAKIYGISDLHFRDDVPDSYYQYVDYFEKNGKADFLFLIGDHVHESKKLEKSQELFLDTIGRYALYKGTVFGNHDWLDIDFLGSLEAQLAELGYPNLAQESLSAKGINVVGGDLYRFEKVPDEEYKLIASKFKNQEYNIYVTHNLDFVNSKFRKVIGTMPNLVLHGHTHSGLVPKGVLWLIAHGGYLNLNGQVRGIKALANPDGSPLLSINCPGSEYTIGRFIPKGLDFLGNLAYSPGMLHIELKKEL